ncbi:hypothetical protein [Halovenus halobia]|uniref:hypothetical protein n=1 Tax=Halovenus halobia TaxID=3396622 RepID=UPI003F57FA2E
MTEPLVIDAGELSVEEIMTTLEEGQRVVVRTEFLGSEHEVTLRYNGGIYYCDTPARLHKHESPDEMQACLRNQGYGTTEQ